MTKGKGRYDKVGNWTKTVTKRLALEARLGKPPESTMEQDEVPAIEMDPAAILNKMAKDRKAELEAKGLAPFLTLTEGENPFRMVPNKPPKICVNKFGREQVLFRVISAKDGGEYDLAMATNSPICRKLLEQMAAKNFGPFNIVRAGMERDTKYSLKGL